MKFDITVDDTKGVPSVVLEFAIPGLVAGRSTYVATESLDTNNDPKTSIYVH